MSKPLARYAALSGYIELSRRFKIDPMHLLRAASLDAAGLDLQDRWIPAGSIARLLETSAAASGRADFALRLAENRRLSALGPLSMSFREQPDARTALTMLIRYQHMYNEALYMEVTDRAGLSTIKVSVDIGEPAPVRQSVELAVAVVRQLLASLLGDRWSPVSVTFTHPAPLDDTTHRRLFDAPLKFSGDYNGIVVYTSDLDQPNRASDPGLVSYAERLLEAQVGDAEPTVEARVHELIEMLLPTGRCSIDQIARSLGVDRRTVHRRLAKAGLTFTQVLDSTRADLAGRLVSGERHSFTEISEMLAFSTPSSFSRWFTQQFGVSPRQWRKQTRPADPEAFRDQPDESA
ncbi:AraC family transcriptional regulator [Gordonia neofelifaecis]|uniref:Arac family transcriptional regulator n=1 Tax=Gordonia neofelifaecis NRRL B-59395 TaxID=644548 RepID=F1YNF1_9ACTN|nr:AraC family transcriptional regulator [Gordonia neofelifaecis]EGD53705.1 arac family transcriptional regulator [Gordonia neofelifaecis NRRL B-59395]